MNKAVEVIVIGCGPAGLAAMKTLHSAGKKFICLEASYRMGGRVDTVPFANNVVDLGAAFLEGQKGNPLYEMVKPLDLVEYTGPDETESFLSNGEELLKDSVDNFVKKIKTSLKKYDQDSTRSALECVKEIYNTEQDLQKHPLSNLLLEWYIRDAELGGQRDPKTAKTMKALQERWFCEGQWLTWKGKGMKVALDVIAQKIPDPAEELPFDIHFNKEVDSIRWKTATGLVQVACKDASVYEGTSVLSTVSVGVLKERHTTMFQPLLPAEKIKAITSLNMFVFDQIYMEFPTKWWPNTSAFFNLIWRPEDKLKFTSEEHWITEIYKLKTVPDQPNVLLAWTNDEGAKEMEKVSEDDVRKGMDKLLSVLFKNKFDVVPIKSMIRTKWFTNRFERGAYSYRSVMTELNGGSAELLSRPVVDDRGFPVLCFAGEATSTHYHGSVHGAMETGVREAERLIQALK